MRNVAAVNMLYDAFMPETGKRSYHHGDLRASLVKTAAQLLEKKGVSALSLRRVAREAGVSHTAPYRHFRDKQALLEAVAASGFEALEARLDEVVEKHPDDARRQIIEASRVYLDETLTHPERAHLMFGGFIDPETRSATLSEAIESSFMKFVEAIRRGEESLFRDLPTRDLVIALWSAIHGLALLAIGGRIRDMDPELDPNALVERMVENLFAGLAKPQT